MTPVADCSFLMPVNRRRQDPPLNTFNYLTRLASAVMACGVSALGAAGTAAQTITFVPIPPHIYGDVFTVTPTTTADGLTPSLTVLLGPATIEGNTVTLTGVGTVTL